MARFSAILIFYGFFNAKRTNRTIDCKMQIQLQMLHIQLFIQLRRGISTDIQVISANMESHRASELSVKKITKSLGFEGLVLKKIRVLRYFRYFLFNFSHFLVFFEISIYLVFQENWFLVEKIGVSCKKIIRGSVSKLGFSQKVIGVRFGYPLLLLCRHDPKPFKNAP